MSGAPNASNVPAPPPPPQSLPFNVTAINATTATANLPSHHAVSVIPVSGLPLIVTAKDEPKQKPLFHCPIGSKDEKCLAEIKEVPHSENNEEGKIFAEFELEPCNAEDPNQLQVVMLTDDRFNENHRQPNKPLTPTEYLIGCSSKLPLLGGRNAYKVEPQFRRVGRNKFINYMRKRKSVETLKKRQNKDDDDDDIVEEEEEELIEYSPLPPQFALHRQSEEERLNFLDIKSPFKRYIGNAPDHHQRWGARCAEIGDIDGFACSHEQLQRNMQYMKVNKPAFNNDRRRMLDAHLIKRATMSENGAIHPNIKKRSLTSGHAKAVKLFKRQQELKEEEAKMDYVRRWAEGNALPRSFEPLDGPLLLERDFDEDENEAPAFLRRHLDEDNAWEAQTGLKKRENLVTRSPKGGKPPGGVGFNRGPRPMIKRDLINTPEDDEKLETRSFSNRGGRPRGIPRGRRMRKRALSENGFNKRAVTVDDIDVDLDKRSDKSHRGRWRNYRNNYYKRDLQDDLDDKLDKRSNDSHGGKWRNYRNNYYKRDLQEDLDAELDKRSGHSHGGWGGSHHRWKREAPESQRSFELTRRAVSESGKDDLQVNLQKRDFQLEDDLLEKRSLGTSRGRRGPGAGRTTGPAPAVNNAAAARPAPAVNTGAAARPAGMKRDLEDEQDVLETRSLGSDHGRRGPEAIRTTGLAPAVNNAAAGRPVGRMKRDVESDPFDIDDSFEKRSHSNRGPYNAGRGWKKRDLTDSNNEDNLEKRSNGNSYYRKHWKRNDLDDELLEKRQIAALEDYEDIAWERRSNGSGYKMGFNRPWKNKREEAENLHNPALVKRAFSESGKDELQKRNQYWQAGSGNHWAGQWGGGGGGGGGGGEGMRKRQLLHPKKLHLNQDRLEEFLMEHGGVHDVLAFEHELDSDHNIYKRGPKSWDGRGPRSPFGPRRGRRGWRRLRHGPGPRSRGRGPPPPPSPGDDDWIRRDLAFDDDDDAMTIRSVLTTHGDIFARGLDDSEESQAQEVQKRDQSQSQIVQKRETMTAAEAPIVQKRDTIASAAWNWAMKKLVK